MTTKEVVEKLKRFSKEENIKKKERYGIFPSDAIGVLLADVKNLAKEVGKNEAIGKALFKNDIYEARLMGAYIFPPKSLDGELMEQLVVTFDNWEICDCICMNLFAKTKDKNLLLEKINAWSRSEEEFIKRAGLVLMTCLSFNFKKEENTTFEKFYPVLVRESSDERVYVKKAVSWALRTFGKRNIDLNKSAIQVAYEIRKHDNKAAQWIAKDVLKELTKEKLTILGYPRNLYKEVV